MKYSIHCCMYSLSLCMWQNQIKTTIIWLPMTARSHLQRLLNVRPIEVAHRTLIYNEGLSVTGAVRFVGNYNLCLRAVIGQSIFSTLWHQ